MVWEVGEFYWNDDTFIEKTRVISSFENKEDALEFAKFVQEENPKLKGHIYVIRGGLSGNKRTATTNR